MAIAGVNVRDIMPPGVNLMWLFVYLPDAIDANAAWFVPRVVLLPRHLPLNQQLEQARQHFLTVVAGER